MIRILISLFILGSFSFAAFAQNQGTRLRGHTEMAATLQNRIMTTGETFSFYPYLSGLDGNTAKSLLDLTGTRPQGGGDIINGNPNALNMLVLKLVLYKFSKAIASGCNHTVAKWNSSFRHALYNICEWPKDSAKDPKVMEAFWLSLMGYDAPHEELEAWRNFFLSSSYKNRSAKETVAAMSFAILYNPHFLIKH